MSSSFMNNLLPRNIQFMSKNGTIIEFQANEDGTLLIKIISETDYFLQRRGSGEIRLFKDQVEFLKKFMGGKWP